MIDRLAQALASAGVEVDAIELAEILWMATRRPAGDSPPPVPAPPAESPLADAADPSPAAPATAAPASSVAAPPMYLLPSRSVTTSQQATEVRLPAPVALPGRLRLGRALRALKRKRPAARRTEFDLDATIELYGNTGLLMPLLRRGTERWFDVTLVVDTGPTMDVWAQTTLELAKLLAGQGTFRRVRRLRLTTTTGSPQLVTDTGRHLHPDRLTDPERRQLIMVVTDCVGPAWYGSQVWPAIREWGRHGPVVLVQPLPQRLWESTALGPTDARLTSYRPAQPNHGLRVTWPWWWIADEDERTDVVPVVALSDTDLSRWARMVMGGADSPVAGVLTEPAESSPVPLPSLSPVERVAAFKSTVSNEAYQLAVCLAAVPIRLPVARIVQYSMLGTQSLVPLAEVFAGGLLRRMTLAEEDLPPDEVGYDFVDGVREVLQGSLTGSQTLAIFRAVARYLESAYGTGMSFSALLAGAEGGTELDPQFRPFAEVSTRLMDRLGLRSRPAPTDTVQPPQQPLAPLGWERVFLVGEDPEIEDFIDWLRDARNLPESPIFSLSSDITSITEPLMTPSPAGVWSGLVFILAVGEAAAHSVSTLEAELEDVSPVVVVTLTNSTSVSGSLRRSTQRKATLQYNGASISDVIEALSGAAVDRTGATTVETFDDFMTARSRSNASILRGSEQVLLRPARGEAGIRRRRALVIGMGPGERGAQLVANRLAALGYTVRQVIGDKNARSSNVVKTLESIADTARVDDLFWLHIAGEGGQHTDGTTLVLPGVTAQIGLEDMRKTGEQCGGTVVITEDMLMQSRRASVTFLFENRSAATLARQFISVRSMANHLHPVLLDLLVWTPGASLGDLADHFRNDSTFTLSTRGSLTASIAVRSGRGDPLLDIDLVRIPAGDFYSGLTTAQRSEVEGRKPKLGRTRNLPAFSISRFPITNAQFARFTKATNRLHTPSHWHGPLPPEEIADHPVIQVGHGTANAYCRWLAQTTGLPIRLPTALEWEKAARGTDGRKFPWGDEFDPARASHRRRSTVSVRTFSPAGDSPFGVADTVGNVREWTSDSKTQSVLGFAPTKSVIVCGGGMIANHESQLWCSHQTELSDDRKASIGFRVALSLDS